MDLKIPLYFCSDEGENEPVNFSGMAFPGKIIFVDVKKI